MSISGPGTNLLTISGNNAVRCLSLTPNNRYDFRSYHCQCKATGYANGAAIANAGHLTISNCALINNTNLGGWAEQYLTEAMRYHQLQLFRKLRPR